MINKDFIDASMSIISTNQMKRTYILRCQDVHTNVKYRSLVGVYPLTKGPCFVLFMLIFRSAVNSAGSNYSKDDKAPSVVCVSLFHLSFLVRSQGLGLVFVTLKERKGKIDVKLTDTTQQTCSTCDRYAMCVSSQPTIKIDNNTAYWLKSSFNYS